MAQTPCPEVALPFECEVINVTSGLPDYYELDETNIQDFIDFAPGNAVERWQGTTPITIYYTTPQMSDHSSYNNCVKQSDLDNCIAECFAAWESICPGLFNIIQTTSIPAGANGISMQWDAQANDFDPVDDQNGNLTSIDVGVTDPGQAGDNMELQHPKIYLDNSSTFNSRYVFTTCPQQCTILPPQIAVPICEVMLHEIGHAFGLQDLYDDPRGAGKNYSQGVMWGENSSDEGGCPEKGLQDVDICYFCKLYCPENCETLGAPLPPDDTSMSISLFPNPATLSFTVLYKSAEPYSSLVIEDIMGRPVEHQKLPGSEGSLMVSRKKLPAGAYIIKLQGEQHFVVKLLIIQ
jgi:hypothetical protein